MTFFSRLMALFPFSVLLLTGLSCWAVLRMPAWWTLLLPFGIIYLYPVLAFRLVNLFKPLQEGNFNLSKREYSPWWGSHQFQLIYYACPFLEAVLRLIPGVYSFWLRLWGAKLGKNIYWTPNVEISDRPLLEISTGVVVGHKVHFLSHVIIPYKNSLRLYVKKIQVGTGCFLGAGSRLGPGVVVDDGVVLQVLTDGAINQHFKAQSNVNTGRNTDSDNVKT